MEHTELDNDTRGWIMSLVSGIACVVGASVICVDLLIRHIPGKPDFKIEQSNVFLASSLSLSFGVMLFSALVGMYPSSKNYLRRAGFSASATGWIILGCFIAGFVGIQVVSRFLHELIPSHVVDCDHNHDGIHSEYRSHHHSPSRAQQGRGQNRCDSPHLEPQVESNGNRSATESTPLLNGGFSLDGATHSKHNSQRKASFRGDESERESLVASRGSYASRRPSMVEVHKRMMSFVKDTKTNCDEEGPCFGYSDPCGQECFKHIGSKSQLSSRRPTTIRTATGNRSGRITTIPQEVTEENDESADAGSLAPMTPTRVARAQSRDVVETSDESSDTDDVEAQHHHHVPENPFLSIGLQTSIAIALHKLPEGFITYATNHANPSLGFTVFVALFIHNITEGFAMALPLYLALGSRLRAMFWSSLLGGVSQPLGAGIAAMWFKLAQHTDHVPGFAAYGCMFAVTAGIMTSVAIQLFMESLSLNHNSNLVTAFALIGMAIMGSSSALTAE